MIHYQFPELPGIQHFVISTLLGDLQAAGWTVARVTDAEENTHIVPVEIESPEMAVQAILAFGTATPVFANAHGKNATIRLASGSQTGLGMVTDWSCKADQGFDTLVEKFIRELPARILKIAPDMELDPEALRTKYEATGEHPQHDMSVWKQAVQSDETIRGYWEWVHAVVDEAAFDSDAWSTPSPA